MIAFMMILTATNVAMIIIKIVIEIIIQILKVVVFVLVIILNVLFSKLQNQSAFVINIKNFMTKFQHFYS
jgi:hypothetical protein